LDTKWKSRAILAAWIFLFAFGCSAIVTVATDAGDYARKNYFHTADFQSQLDKLIDYLTVFELQDLPIREAKRQIEVTPLEIEEYRFREGDLSQRLAALKEEYDPRITEALGAGDEEIAELYTAELERRIEDLTELFRSDEYARMLIVAEKEREIDAYYREKEHLRGEYMKLRSAFAYRLKDVESGIVYTNVQSEDGAGAELHDEDMRYVQRYASLSTAGRPYRFYIQGGHLVPKPPGPFEGEIGVLKSAPPTSDVMISYNGFQAEQTAFLLYSISGLAALGGSIMLRRKCGARARVNIERLEPFYRRIPLDIRFLSFGVAAIVLLVLLFSADDAFLYRGAEAMIGQSVVVLIFTAIFLALVIVQGKLLREELRSLSALREAWSHALVCRGYRRVKAALLIKSIAFQTMLLLAIAFGFGFGVVPVIMEPEGVLIYFPLFVVIGVPALWLVVKRIGYFNQIAVHVARLAEGQLEPDLPVKGSSVLAALAGHVNVLKQKVKSSRTEQAKSERLKTELITNVSHDLRTPLTSIITYTELLKHPELPAEERNAYIEIIDRKSQRLKALIDDLFEASKMASGHIQLEKEKVDLVQLLQQALAEHSEAMQQSDAQFRVSLPDEPALALVDGPKLWRVFDNLIGNCLKYAMEHTRVYITMKISPHQTDIVFKNVSKYELSDNVDELFERFKRGDASRHTEGSGLGLAIAKSIVDLHDGSLELEVDGDLFKVTVALPAA